ncbi:MAG: 4Fe-4S dicluster domain-containing protein [Planctomycetota bacterium]|nr:MAG: 4Fe-4S dicluster domain-containing protein [Planctomycetota bacterium]
MMDQGEHKQARLRRLRVSVQIVCLGLFVYLALAARFKWKAPLPYDLFLRFDPVVWLIVSAATREAALYGSFALALVVATALFGRMFCGWVCPLGTAIDAAHFVQDRRPSGSLVERLSSIRFWILIVLIGAALVGVNLVGWLDPLVMSSRALHLGYGARLHWAATAVVWTAVAVVIGLVFFAPRFWCRALCPLGAALSLVACLAPCRRRVGESCTNCGACSDACPMGQSSIKNSPAECIGCRRCEAACPEQAIAFTLDISSIRGIHHSEGEQPINPWRRRFVLGLGSLAVGGVARFIVRAKPSRTLLRPPGTPSEQRFLARCVGCGTCLATCPTGGLLPLISAHRLDAAFTPVFVPRVGPCLPDCTACGEACPTGAISRVPANRKKTIQIGLAVIDRARCIPWAGGERCVICLDACPAEYDAIELRQVETGEFRPYVKERLCTGCGICEYKCPVEGKSAVQVVASKEMTAAK